MLGAAAAAGSSTTNQSTPPAFRNRNTPSPSGPAHTDDCRDPESQSSEQSDPGHIPRGTPRQGRHVRSHESLCADMAGSIEEQLNLPALDPPPGVTPVFNPNADLPWFVPATVIITVIPGLLVLLRLYTKIRIVRKTDITECRHSSQM